MENNMQKDNIVKKVSLRGTRNIDESQMQTGTKDLQRGNATLFSMSERGVNSENSWRRFQVAHETGGDHRKILWKLDYLHGVSCWGKSSKVHHG